MSNQVTIVGITPHNAFAEINEELLAQALRSISGLELEAGMQLEAPGTRTPGEAEGPEYRSYIAAAQYSGSIETLREALRELPITETAAMDLSAVPAELTSDEKKLVVLDVDSTLIQHEVIDELAEVAGTGEQVRKITQLAMQGELDFEASLRERVATLKGQPEHILSDLAEQIIFTPGAQTLINALHEHGHVVGAVSGGFIEVLRPIAERSSLDFARANALDIRKGELIGEVYGTVITPEEKKKALKEWAKEAGVSKKQIIAVGDGANDELMMEEAALSIAFNAKPQTRQKADAQINVLRLDAVRHFIGI